MQPWFIGHSYFNSIFRRIKGASGGLVRLQIESSKIEYIAREFSSIHLKISGNFILVGFGV